MLRGCTAQLSEKHIGSIARLIHWRRAVLSALCSVDAQAAQQWRRMKDGERWGQRWGLQALAAADRVQLVLGAHMDRLYALVQPHAEAFQAACSIDQVAPAGRARAAPSGLGCFQNATPKSATRTVCSSN